VSSDSAGWVTRLGGFELPVLFGKVRRWPYQEFDVDGNYREDLSGTYELDDSSTFAMFLGDESTIDPAPLWCSKHGTLSLDSKWACEKFLKNEQAPSPKKNPFAKHGRLESHAPANHLLFDKFASVPGATRTAASVGFVHGFVPKIDAEQPVHDQPR
jgi:hypothetical protein